jgi:streptomycin 6-kinase
MYDARLVPALIEFSTNARGDDGRRWLEDLPRLIGECEEHFGVEALEALPGGSQNCVLSCISAEGQPAVLKIGFRYETIEREATALSHWRARVPKLLGYDRHRSALLLERINEPSDRPERASTEELAHMLKELHGGGAPAGDLPTLRESQLENLDRIDRTVLVTPGIPASLVSEARALVFRLASGELNKVLLHGDPRPGNMLYSDAREWLFIDPDPQIGDPAYDVGFWALSTIGAQSLVDRSHELASATGLRPEHVLGWAWISAIRHAFLRARVNDPTAPQLAQHVTAEESLSRVRAI